MNLTFAFLIFMSTLSSPGIEEVNGGFFIPHDDMLHIMAYTEKLEEENRVQLDFIKEQENTINELIIKNEELLSQQGAECVGWQITVGAMGAIIVTIVTYGILVN